MGLDEPMPTLPLEAIVTNSVPRLFSIDNRSVVPVPWKLERIVKRFSESLLEIISNEAVAVVA